MTSSIARGLIERDLFCYQSNMLRKCYDHDASVKSDVAQVIENLQYALDEIDAIRTETIAQLWYNLIMNTITLSFQDLNIKPLDFNAQRFSMARAEIINRACDTIMHFYFQDEAEEDCLFNVADAHVDMILQTVTIETATLQRQ